MKGVPFGDYLSVLLIVIYQSFSLTVADDTFSHWCTSKHGAFLPHPYDCTKFLRCSHDKAYVFQCPANLRWSQTLLTCDFAERTVCSLNESNMGVTITGNVIKRAVKRDTHQQTANESHETFDNQEKTKIKGNLHKTTESAKMETVNCTKSVKDGMDNVNLAEPIVEPATHKTEELQTLSTTQQSMEKSKTDFHTNLESQPTELGTSEALKAAETPENITNTTADYITVGVETVNNVAVTTKPHNDMSITEGMATSFTEQRKNYVMLTTYWPKILEDFLDKTKISKEIKDDITSKDTTSFYENGAETSTEIQQSSHLLGKESNVVLTLSTTETNFGEAMKTDAVAFEIQQDPLLTLTPNTYNEILNTVIENELNTDLAESSTNAITTMEEITENQKNVMWQIGEQVQIESGKYTVVTDNSFYSTEQSVNLLDKETKHNAELTEQGYSDATTTASVALASQIVTEPEQGPLLMVTAEITDEILSELTESATNVMFTTNKSFTEKSDLTSTDYAALVSQVVREQEQGPLLMVTRDAARESSTEITEEILSELTESATNVMFTTDKSFTEKIGLTSTDSVALVSQVVTEQEQGLLLMVTRDATRKSAKTEITQEFLSGLTESATNVMFTTDKSDLASTDSVDLGSQVVTEQEQGTLLMVTTDATRESAKTEITQEFLSGLTESATNVMFTTDKSYTEQSDSMAALNLIDYADLTNFEKTTEFVVHSTHGPDLIESTTIDKSDVKLTETTLTEPKITTLNPSDSAEQEKVKQATLAYFLAESTVLGSESLDIKSTNTAGPIEKGDIPQFPPSTVSPGVNTKSATDNSVTENSVDSTNLKSESNIILVSNSLISTTLIITPDKSTEIPTDYTNSAKLTETTLTESDSVENMENMEQTTTDIENYIILTIDNADGDILIPTFSPNLAEDDQPESPILTVLPLVNADLITNPEKYAGDNSVTEFSVDSTTTDNFLTENDIISTSDEAKRDILITRYSTNLAEDAFPESSILTVLPDLITNPEKYAGDNSVTEFSVDSTTTDNFLTENDIISTSEEAESDILITTYSPNLAEDDQPESPILTVLPLVNADLITNPEKYAGDNSVTEFSVDSTTTDNFSTENSIFLTSEEAESDILITTYSPNLAEDDFPASSILTVLPDLVTNREKYAGENSATEFSVDTTTTDNFLTENSIFSTSEEAESDILITTYSPNLAEYEFPESSTLTVLALVNTDLITNPDNYATENSVTEFSVDSTTTENFSTENDINSINQDVKGDLLIPTYFPNSAEDDFPESSILTVLPDLITNPEKYAGDNSVTEFSVDSTTTDNFSTENIIISISEEAESDLLITSYFPNSAEDDFQESSTLTVLPPENPATDNSATEFNDNLVANKIETNIMLTTTKNIETTTATEQLTVTPLTETGSFHPNSFDAVDNFENVETTTRDNYYDETTLISTADDDEIDVTVTKDFPKYTEENLPEMDNITDTSTVKTDLITNFETYAATELKSEINTILPSISDIYSYIETTTNSLNLPETTLTESDRSTTTDNYLAKSSVSEVMAATNSVYLVEEDLTALPLFKTVPIEDPETYTTDNSTAEVSVNSTEINIMLTTNSATLATTLKYMETATDNLENVEETTTAENSLTESTFISTIGDDESEIVLTTESVNLAEESLTELSTLTELVNLAEESSTELSTLTATGTPLVNKELIMGNSAPEYTEYTVEKSKYLETTTELDTMASAITEIVVDITEPANKDILNSRDSQERLKVTEATAVTDLLMESNEAAAAVNDNVYDTLHEIMESNEQHEVTKVNDNNVHGNIPESPSIAIMDVYGGLSEDAATTLDPRLPFRSPACQGDGNRRQFQGTKCYQYYQCFAGWAFLLNCHDGHFFEPQAGSCVEDYKMECQE